MRPPVLNQEQGDAKSRGSNDSKTQDDRMQAFVDNVLRAAVRSVSGQEYAEKSEMMSAVKAGVLSYVRTSPFAAAVDFQHFEVSSIREDKDRLVSNTLLNPDGSEHSGQLPAKVSSQSSTSDDAQRTQPRTPLASDTASSGPPAPSSQGSRVSSEGGEVSKNIVTADTGFQSL